jgi:hypothetical protein
VPDKEPDDLVFTMPGGSMLRLPNWRRAVFLSARTRALAHLRQTLVTVGALRERDEEMAA